MNLLEHLFIHYLTSGGNTYAGAFELAASAYEHFQKASMSVLPHTVSNTDQLFSLEALAGAAKRADKNLPVFPSALDTPAFRQAWDEWVAYRREAKFTPWKPATVRAALAELEVIGPDAAAGAIRRSIAKGWKGIFPDNGVAAGAKGSHDCDRCSGKGFLEKPDSCGGWTMVKEPCKRCQGTGKF